MLKALIFDSYFDKHRGVIAFVRLFQGELKASQEVVLLATGTKIVVQEVGIFNPEMKSIDKLTSGEVGYIVTGLKALDKVKVGDTVCDNNDIANALDGYAVCNPMVFASIFPTDADDYHKLRDSIAKLKLNDASLTSEVENIPALGFGFRCGFLGLLHMDIIQERLTREFDLDMVITTPSVEYKIRTSNDELNKNKSQDGYVSIHTPAELPDPTQILETQEPWVKLEILAPESYIGGIIQLISDHRGIYTNMSFLSMNQVQITGEVPLAEMIINFYDELKSLSKGYATMSYELLEYRTQPLVKIDILVNGKEVAPLSIIDHRNRAEARGREVCSKLKELIPRQQFEVAVQAVIGGRVIARETIKAFRKDVTAKLYGGDITRRMKLLKKQSEGKKRMKMVGNVEIPQSAFLNVLKK
jgi:GTP-binding protein LepA